MSGEGRIYEGDIQELIDLLESHTKKIEELMKENHQIKQLNSDLQAQNIRLEDQIVSLKLESAGLKHELHVVSTALSLKSADINTGNNGQPKMEIPHILSNYYTLGEKLGEGGYSVVKAGVSKTDGTKVAVKIITRKTLQKDDLESIYQEVRTLQSLKHEHIVRAVDFFEEEDYLYVVMECIEGGELFDRIVAKTFYNEKEARDLVNIVLNVLKYCHDRNIIHRDLKPENLLLASKTDDTTIKLADFGFSVQVDGNNITTQCGTPGYIAPEILRKIPYGKSVDMWSFGVIIFILLGGYPPFHHDNQRELFKKIVRGDYEFHADYWSGVSEEAKDLIRGLLTVDPEKRLTVDQALAHPWLQRSASELAARNLNENLAHLRKYQAMRKMRAGVKAIMAVNKMRNLIAGTKKAAAAQASNDISRAASDAVADVEKKVELPHTLNDRYTLGEKLGEGGFSVVKEGFNKLNNDKVAVKIITREGLKPDEVQALRKEVSILQTLNHDNIVRAVDFFEEDKHIYVVMECIEGGELFDRIVAKTFYNEKEARDLVFLLLQVLKYCHDQNIIHRDLKPENLLLTSKEDDANIKLADFGFATEVDGFNCHSQVGTPGYIAPEIIQNKHYGKPVDMWSFGVILYILLGGYPPFHDDNQSQLFKKIVAGAYEFHADYWGGVSEEAKDLIRGLLTVDPEKRLTVDQALAHPWLQKNGDELAANNLDENLTTLRKYVNSRKFKAGVKAVMAVNKMKNLLSAVKKAASATPPPPPPSDTTAVTADAVPPMPPAPPAPLVGVAVPIVVTGGSNKAEEAGITEI